MLRKLFHGVLNPALAVSLAIYATVGYVLSQFLQPMPIAVWGVVLIASAAACITIFAFVTRDFHPPTPSGADTSAGRGAGEGGALGTALQYLPYVLLLPGMLAFVITVRTQISHHGFFHSGYVYQILAGYAPPETAVLPGHPANIYWLYHALLATITGLTHLPVPLASVAVNFVALISTFGWMARAIRASGLLEERPPAMGIFVLFSLFGASLLGAVQAIAWGSAHGESLLSPLNRMVLLGDLRMGSLLASFITFTGFPMGVMFYAFALYVTVRMLTGRLRLMDVMLLIIATLGALAFHTTSGLFIGSVLPASLLAAFVTSEALEASGLNRALASRWLADLKAAIREEAKKGRLLVAVLAAVALSIPILHYVLSAASAMPGTHFEGCSLYDLGSILMASYGLLPFFVLGVGRAIRRHDRHIIFAAYICLIGYGLACLVRLPEHNEYKFIYMSTIAMCVVALYAIEYLLFESPRPTGAGYVLGRAGAIIALIMLAVNLLYVGGQRLSMPWVQVKALRYEGQHVITKGQKGLDQAGVDTEYRDVFQWIRENTPANTAIVTPFVSKDDSLLYVLAERLPYVAWGDHYGEGLPGYEERHAAVEALYAPESTPEQRGEAVAFIKNTGFERPVVVILPHKLTKSVDPAQLGLALLYEGKKADLFSLQDD
jgi:hypothetical protein